MASDLPYIGIRALAIDAGSALVEDLVGLSCSHRGVFLPLTAHCANLLLCVKNMARAGCANHRACAANHQEVGVTRKGLQSSMLAHATGSSLTNVAGTVAHARDFPPVPEAFPRTGKPLFVAAWRISPFTFKSG